AGEDHLALLRPYYFLDPSVFLAVWAVSSPALGRGWRNGRVLALPVAAIGWSFCSLFAFWLASELADRIRGSVLLCALICIVLVPFALHLLRRTPELAQELVATVQAKGNGQVALVLPLTMNHAEHEGEK